MGAGLARQFQERFPAMFRYYRQACEVGGIQIGSIWRYCEDDRWILGFPTKNHWRDPSRMEYIADGLIALRRVIETLSLQSIAIPQLGCGCGGLKWRDVHKEIVTILTDLPDTVDVQIYGPR